MTARGFAALVAGWLVLLVIGTYPDEARQVFQWGLGATAAVCVLWLVVWFLSPGLMAHVDDEAAEITR